MSGVDAPQGEEEMALLQRAKRGDRAAFGALVERHQGRLRTVAGCWITDSDDVWDVVQDAFLDAWRGMPSFDVARPFGPWLRSICRNRCVRFLRERARLPRAESALDAVLAERAAMPEEPAGTLTVGDRIEALRHCLSKLGGEQRELLQRRYGDGVAVQDLAAATGRSANALSMVLLRIKDALARCIERQTAQDGATP